MHKAISFYEKAGSYRSIASFYEKGIGVERDDAIRIKWLTMWSQDGEDGSTNYTIGMIYLNGGGNVSRDYEMALIYLRKSARSSSGYAFARQQLQKLGEDW